MKIVHHIDLGFPQQTFDFDQSHALDLKEILAFIDRWIAENDHAMLDQVIRHLTLRQNEWSAIYVLDSVNTLFKDDKIHFLIDGEKFLPGSVKTNFSKLEKSKSQFVQRRERFSVIRTHLSDSDRWKDVEIIKPERVKESDLLRAQILEKKLFGTAGGVGQNSLCRSLRKHLRKWNNDLEMFRKVSGKGQYPGSNEIQDELVFTRKLLGVHDPCEFIKIFISDEDRLHDAACHFKILENFYKIQIHTWDILLKALENFKQNREEIEKDIDAKKAFDALYTILTNPNPYSMIDEIPVLISTVKPVNDFIIGEKTASAKAIAFEKIEQIIDKIVNALDEKKAHSDIRNKALYPLQRIKRKINAASSIRDIDECLEEAETELDYAMELYIS